MTMIERVAKAYFETYGREYARRAPAALTQFDGPPEKWEDAPGPIKMLNRLAARAAIEAMREPTDGQRNKYYELSFRTEPFVDVSWERGIDAALKEAP